MSQSSGSDDNPVAGIAVVAAIICFFLGFDKGGLGGGVAAAVVAFGGVFMAFAAIGLALRLIAGGVVLLLVLAALKNRWDWLAGMLQ
ncbi:hypothetical protein [Oceanibaculum indicum]|uniref:Transmembrane protein n=1 Tax=Oceanibaculum indicum P24 TaxID=1207063 RepID=K2IEL6_9PROT|nr:hypothetical protein [Oceanibaculum indicum]EKE68471.1 hypothetical protein P24_17613 [Oceanibaculum indicum P24]